jgi:hypothetical protein
MASDATPMTAGTVQTSAMEPDFRVARLGTRIGGYVIDMVIFAAVAMLSAVIAGSLLLIATDGATQDPTDRQLHTFLGIIALGTPFFWTLLNLFLLVTRGQTGGQYVAGVRLRRDDAGPVTLKTAAAWWFSLNPLLFSWPMAVVVGFPLAALVALLLDELTLAAFGLVVTLCVVSPLIALVSASMDRRNRALHDRVASVVAVPAAQD